MVLSFSPCYDVRSILPFLIAVGVSEFLSSSPSEVVQG